MLKYVIGVLVLLAVIVGGYLFIKGQTQSASQEPATTTEQVPATSTYASTTMDISVTYPASFTVDENHVYTEVNPSKPIHGVRFTIPLAMATGTNLGADSYVSIEQLPRAKNCTGDIYLAANVKPVVVNDSNGVAYSVASSTGAAAGNMYEEQVWAVTGSKPCTAVRYFIHSSNIGNFDPASGIREFDRLTLLNAFDEIRRSVLLSATAGPATEAPIETPVGQ